MRSFDPVIFTEIKQELEFLCAVQAAAKCYGEMRLFAPKSGGLFKSHEAGFEVWFDADRIDEAIAKLVVFYRNAEAPNTPLFLDPMVYKRDAQDPTPVGSGFLWCAAYGDAQRGVSDDTLSRLDELGVQYSLITARMADGQQVERAGIKCFLPLKARVTPESGSPAPQTVQALADLLDISSEQPVGHLYPLSGINYVTENGTTYQQPKFTDLFASGALPEVRQLEEQQVFAEKIDDAATCWNAYGRDMVVYTRYGVDVRSLERNLSAMQVASAKVQDITRELQTLWAANLRYGLKGKMRLYTASSQNVFRTKDEGLELWYGSSQDDIAAVASQIEFYYNAGTLPNSPLLLDPIVYAAGADGAPEPLGTGMMWASAMSDATKAFEDDALERMRDVGAYVGRFTRAQQFDAGLKVIAFLDEPYWCTDEDKEQFKRMRAEKVVGPLQLAGTQALFELAGANANMYAAFLPITGMEYLCANGAYANLEMEQPWPETSQAQRDMMGAYTVRLARILEAQRCWQAYDQGHLLWQRFGIDEENLARNLQYYELCGRDLTLLSMTGESRASTEEEFEFLVPGWIPKSAITIIGATGGTGKSSVAHRLAVLTSTDWDEDDPNPKWLGSEIDKKDCQGVAVYFSGEDAAPIVNARAAMFDPEGRSKRLLLHCGADFGTRADGTPKDIGDFLEGLHVLPKVDVVVIDPARKYLVGDEDDSEVVSQFFEAIEKFAIEKNCGMVVVHHLQKQAHPNDTRDILDLLRGSQVFIDRARVVIGMMRDGAYTLAGLAKNNIPPSLGLVEGERVFVRDPERLDLLWVPGEEGVRHWDVTEEELKEIKNQVESDINLGQSPG